MKRQQAGQAVRTIKARVRLHAFTISPFAYERMIDQFIYEEDIERAVSTSRLIEIREDRRAATHYRLCGFGMNEEPLILVCRILRRRIEIVDLEWS